jgi:hypothetical protein
MAQHLTCLRRALSAPRCSLHSPALHAYPSGRQRCHSGAALQVRWIKFVSNDGQSHIECFSRQPPPPPVHTTTSSSRSPRLPFFSLQPTKPILVCITHPSRGFGNVTHLAIISSSLQKLLHLQRCKETSARTLPLPPAVMPGLPPPAAAGPTTRRFSPGERGVAKTKNAQVHTIQSPMNGAGRVLCAA